MDHTGLSRIYRDGLFNDVLPFWTDHAFDSHYGGYITALDRDGTILDTDKSIWQQGRFAWLLGELYNNAEPNPDWLHWARTGIDFLDRFGVDPRDGLMWFQVTREGRPLRKRRYRFSECFAALAFGEFAQATGESVWADKAIAAFDAFVTSGPSPSPPKFEATRPAISLGHPMCTIHLAQQLRDSIGLSTADEWINRSIEIIETKHVKNEIGAVMETVAPDGGILDHFDGRLLNPGHAIEAAWFVMTEGQHRQDSQLVTLGKTMLDYMFQRGWDTEFGGLLYFVDVDEKPVQEYWHDMKFWWPHNEAIIATLMAFQLTGDQAYRRWHAQVHQWSYEHFADSEFGEWYGYLRRDGTPTNKMKGNLWKGPYHLPRMQLTCWKMLADGEVRSQ